MIRVTAPRTVESRPQDLVRARPRSARRSPRRRPLAPSARARRQRREDTVAFEARPLVRWARAAGLPGGVLRAYVAAVDAVDGTD